MALTVTVNFWPSNVIMSFSCFSKCQMGPITRVLRTYTQPPLRGSRSSPVISFSRLAKLTPEEHPKCFFFFQFPPSDPVVPDTWHRDRQSQAVESNLPGLRVLSGQGRLQVSYCSKGPKHEDVVQSAKSKQKRTGSMKRKKKHWNQAEVAVRWFRRLQAKQGSQ